MYFAGRSHRAYITTPATTIDTTWLLQAEPQGSRPRGLYKQGLTGMESKPRKAGTAQPGNVLLL